MINDESLRIVRESQMNKRFGKPIYSGYGFAALPDTIKYLLTGVESPRMVPERGFGILPRKADKVIVLFIDAFGWMFVERYYDKFPFLRRIAAEGVISQMTTQFPSTTTAHTTTIHTGLTVGESGLYEWFIYEPTLDDLIIPLMYSYAGDTQRNTLKRSAANPRTIYPRRNIYQTLNGAGIKSYVFLSREYAHSPFGEVVNDGAKVTSFRSLSEGLYNLSQAVIHESGKGYYFWYYDLIDTMAHLYGPNSAQVEAEIITCLSALENILHRELAGKVKDTLLLVTADHGQAEVSPETVIYLNQTLPGLTPMIKTNRRGQALVPAGSPRDMFLHLKPEAIDEALDLLSRHLEGRAEVYRVSDMINAGYFGEQVSEAFRARVGDVVVLPYAHESVWWYLKDRVELRFLGMHGGLLPEEMQTSLMVMPYFE